MTVIKEKSRQWTLIFGLTVVLSMTAFFMMYLINNEYTVKGEQPIQGILCLDDKDAAAKLHYLAREWQYFPGKLLTPEMLKKDPGYYSCYISIGERNEMELGNKEASTYGCGTYRMFLILPEEEKIWAISMAEVFSAYRIYINGELAGEVGDPDEKTYMDRIMNRVFTFQGSGVVEIVIAVADKSHIRPGIQAIPVLGSPVRVSIQRGLRVLGSGCAIAFCICIMFGTLMVHVRTRTKEFAIFKLVCLCVAGYSLCSLVHNFFLLPTKPWYALETMIYYLILSCMIRLEDCIIGKKRGIYLFLLIDLWIVVAFFLEIFADILPSARLLYDVVWISEAVKWVAAIYMLLNTFGETDCRYGKIVLVGTTIYACSLVADRIGYLYEPILGGGFPETGGLILTAAFGCVLWRDLSEAYKISLTYEVYSHQTELRLLAQKNHYDRLKEQMEETSRVRHDMRQHLRVLSALLEREQYGEMQKYLCRYTREFQERLTYHSYCKNQVADAILHYYEELCRKNGIVFQCQVEAPEKTGIQDTDFCRLFGNLLENAIEAAQLCPKGSSRFVRVQIRTRNNKLLIKEENSCTDPLRRNKTGFFSGKHSGQGIGTASIMEIAARYGGFADFQSENGIFKAEIFLHLTQRDTEDRLYG